MTNEQITQITTGILEIKNDIERIAEKQDEMVRDMRDVKLQSILSCSKGRSWHLGGFSGHSFSKELRLISSFHHLGNDMAIKAYTIKCQNYHKKTFRHAK